MSAKKQAKRPSKKAQEDAEILVELLRNILSEDEFREFGERALNPEKAAEADRREEEDRRMEEFIGSISGIPAGFELPDGFEEMWEVLVSGYEEETRKRHAASDKNAKPKDFDVFIKRGWITADAKALELRSHPRKPADEFHPIPAVLINDDGKWKAPTALNMLIRSHPFVRAITETLPELTKREQVAQVMQWAETCRPDNPDDNHYGTILAQSAELLDLFLYEQAFGDPAEFGWMHAAKQSQQFWDILDAAIGFGRSLQNHEIYGDGSVEDLIIKGLLQTRGRTPDKLTYVMEELMDGYRKEYGMEATAKKLLVWVGGKISSASDKPLILPEECSGRLKGITWDKWSNTVKDLKKKRK
jgi:hypothetical protein